MGYPKDPYFTPPTFDRSQRKAIPQDMGASAPPGVPRDPWMPGAPISGQPGPYTGPVGMPVAPPNPIPGAGMPVQPQPDLPPAPPQPMPLPYPNPPQFPINPPKQPVGGGSPVGPGVNPGGSPVGPGVNPGGSPDPGPNGPPMPIIPGGSGMRPVRQPGGPVISNNPWDYHGDPGFPSTNRPRRPV